MANLTENSVGTATPHIQLITPETTDELAATSGIFREYAISLGFDLCFQDFEGEIATSDYVNAAEMKRLYVRPGFRGLGLGRQLAEAILDEARMGGYDSVLLDTLDDMEIARAMYEELGFKEIPPYYHNPLAGAHYLKVDL
jgi:putative acetyltransferase